MDEMEALDYAGWQFLCSGEQLPSGVYQAVVRYRGPDDLIRTLVLDSEPHASCWQAVVQAKELALEWAIRHPHPHPNHE